MVRCLQPQKVTRTLNFGAFVAFINPMNCNEIVGFLHFGVSFLLGLLKFFFHKEQILLLNGNDFTSDPLTVLRDVETFIGVPKFFKKEHFNFSGNKPLQGMAPTECPSKCLPSCLLVCLLACLLTCLPGNPSGLFSMLAAVCFQSHSKHNIPEAQKRACTDNIRFTRAPVAAKKGTYSFKLFI